MKTPIRFAGIVLCLACSVSRSVSEDEEIAIYSVVIRDFTSRKDVILDPVVMAPIEARMEDRPLPSKEQPSGVVSALKSQGLVIDACRPITVQGAQGCEGDPAPVAIALSAPRPIANAATVSILWHSVCRRAEPLCLGFAVEYQYTLRREGKRWIVLTKDRTMIT